MSAELVTLQAAQSGDEGAFARLVAPYRRELRAHCYRMSGSLHDADDLLQDSLLRAWKGLARFEGRSSLRTWLYKVTTSACVDALERRAARLLPADLGPAAGAGAAVGPSFDQPWLGPCPAALYSAPGASPEERRAERESVTLAFLVALQLLPARQRAVLLLRDVLGWEASECADLLELSVAAVNSALQRARTTLAERAGAARTAPALDDPEVASLLSRYVRAWELADLGALVALLHEDATLAMPPMSQWFAGREAIGASIGGMVFAPAGPGVFRAQPTEANGLPAVAVWRREPGQAEWRPTGVHLLEFRAGRIAAIQAFLDPSLLAEFTP